jgi:hypothetical protein
MGLRNLNYDVSGTPTYAILELDDQNTASIPTDLVKIREVFIATNGGRLPINENKTRNPQTVSQGRISNAVPQTSDLTDGSTYDFVSPEEIAARYRNGEFVGGVFSGNRDGNPYQYLRNYETNRLEFSSNVSGTVVMEYLGNIGVEGEDFVIHPFLEKPLMDWLAWYDAKYKRTVGSGEKERLRRNYYASKNWAKMQFNAESPQAIRNAQRKGYKLTIS